MILIILLSLFHIQEGPNGFNTSDFPNPFRKPCLGVSAFHKTLETTFPRIVVTSILK
jgi:hypothetical protein